jgi:hypothetical protein
LLSLENVMITSVLRRADARLRYLGGTCSAERAELMIRSQVELNEFEEGFARMRMIEKERT